ncbi:ROK family transcriptional regulator [Demetria terragena]|uniref:ROK family transcriptional regulator n=1 Tax=Demetria terragena TaxID=63959 RepID=UPI001FDEE8FE|nr:ROK family transcriptional regulator [Demetria terragena]
MTPASPGSQSALRRRNRETVLSALRSGPSTQAALARRTGLSGATISNIVRALTHEELVATSPTTTSGRRAVSVRLLNRESAVAGIDIGRRHVRVVVASPGYELLGERTRDLPVGHSAQDGTNAAVETYHQVLSDAGLEASAVVGAGIGLPGPIERGSRLVLDGSILPEWVGVDIQSEFERRLHVPVLIDNDANLGARAEVTWGDHQQVEDLIFVKMGTGVGAGLIIGGQQHYGASGLAGEIGHATIDERGPTCRCGNRGCLESYASTSVMIDALRTGSEPLGTADLVRLALQGDTATLRILDDAGFAVGRVIASLANFINPHVVVIGGPLAAVGDALTRPVHRGFVKHALRAIGDATPVVVSELGDRAEALGAAAAVIQKSSGTATLS